MSAECREPSANWVRIGTFLLRASQIKVAYFDAVRGRLVIQTVAEQELYPFYGSKRACLAKLDELHGALTGLRAVEGPASGGEGER